MVWDEIDNEEAEVVLLNVMFILQFGFWPYFDQFILQTYFWTRLLFWAAQLIVPIHI